MAFPVSAALMHLIIIKTKTDFIMATLISKERMSSGIGRSQGTNHRGQLPPHLSPPPGIQQEGGVWVYESVQPLAHWNGLGFSIGVYVISSDMVAIRPQGVGLILTGFNQDPYSDYPYNPSHRVRERGREGGRAGEREGTAVHFDGSCVV